ncbi:MAG TPA: hypothetical protein VKU40_10595, partial [Thermoanaerobaculia bacterium]|nr:hypothetical protein [Thermoanaerobaculia bacterium]
MILVEEQTGEAIQEALNAAFVKQEVTGPVQLLPRIYEVFEPIVLPHGANLIGAYPGVPTNHSQGTILLARNDMEAMVMTDLEQAREGFHVSRILVDGGREWDPEKKEYVGPMVQHGLRLLGRKIRLDSVDVSRITGTGVEFEAGGPET